MITVKQGLFAMVVFLLLVTVSAIELYSNKETEDFVFEIDRFDIKVLDEREGRLSYHEFIPDGQTEPTVKSLSFIDDKTGNTFLLIEDVKSD